MMNVGALRQIVRPLRPLLPPRVVLFAVLFAWFLYAAVDLRLVFLDRDVLFLWNLRYLTDFVGQPGSLLQWSDNLLVQMCYFGWPAAIAIAAVTWLLLVSTVGLMNALGHAKMRGGWLIPAILVATLFGGYEFPTPTIVGLAVAVTAANGWVRMPAPGLAASGSLCCGLDPGVLCYGQGLLLFCGSLCHPQSAERTAVALRDGVLAGRGGREVRRGCCPGPHRPGVAQLLCSFCRKAGGSLARFAPRRSIFAFPSAHCSWSFAGPRPL